MGSYKEKSPSVETERPLTIACHMKKSSSHEFCKRELPPHHSNYIFLVVSFLVVSTAILEVSFLVVSVAILEAESVAGVSVFAPPQAVITLAIARIANNFFSVVSFLLLVNFDVNTGMSYKVTRPLKFF